MLWIRRDGDDVNTFVTRVKNKEPAVKLMGIVDSGCGTLDLWPTRRTGNSLSWPAVQAQLIEKLTARAAEPERTLGVDSSNLSRVRRLRRAVEQATRQALSHRGVLAARRHQNRPERRRCDRCRVHPGHRVRRRCLLAGERGCR
jgi:hypothetical protein